MIKFKVKAPPETVQADEDQTPMMVVKDFPENHILYHIHKNGTREGKPRHHNVVHASDLDPTRNWCAREPALLTLHGKKRKAEFASTAQRMVWQMGYKGADLVMEMIPRKKQWGSWKCLACKQQTTLGYHPENCPSCGAGWLALKYQEVLLRDPKTGVIGSCDLWVDILGNGMKTLVEIKTMGNEGFKIKAKPDFDHEWRTMLYLKLAELTFDGDFAKKHNLNTQEGRIIYVTKEGYADAPKIKEWKLADWARSAMKEYWVNKNDDMVQSKLDYAMTYRAWRNIYDDTPGPKNGLSLMSGTTLPPRTPVATDYHCTRCKGCPVKAECWSTKC